MHVLNFLVTFLLLTTNTALYIERAFVLDVYLLIEGMNHSCALQNLHCCYPTVIDQRIFSSGHGKYRICWYSQDQVNQKRIELKIFPCEVVIPGR